MALRESSIVPLVLLLLLGFGSNSGAAPTAAQRSMLREAAEAVDQAEILLKANKLAPAGKALDRATGLLKEADIEASRDVARSAAPLLKRLKKAHAAALERGVGVLALPSTPAAEKKNPPRGAKSASATVSFTKQIAPMLASKCGGCHISKRSGGVNMATFSTLMQGSQEAGIIISRQRDGRVSRIVEVIESGDMPRGGGSVSAEELAALVLWIEEGAEFDGADRNAPLAPQNVAAPAGAAESMIVKAPASDAIQFARDLGPVLLENCLMCHDGANPPANLSMASFSRLLQGGRNGVPVSPGEPETSLIVKKLRGQADGARMPLNRDPLAEATIARFETWIRLGAKFDGGDPAQPLPELVATISARLATHDELAQRRAAEAAKNWRVILPDLQPQIAETPDFLCYGSVSPERLREVADEADRQVEKLRKLFSAPPRERLVKGRITIYVFDKPYDYAEVGERLEGRPIPPGWKGHWRYTVSDAYICLLPPKRDEYSLSGLVAQQLAGVYIAGLGAPAWFADGSSRVIAARLAPKDARVRKWDERLPAALANSRTPDAFLTGMAAPEDAEALSYSFAKFLMKSPPKFQAALGALRSGDAFDSAFQRAFGGAPNELLAAWAAKAGGK